VVLTSRDSGIAVLPLQVSFPVDIERIGGRLRDLGVTGFSASQGASAVQAVARVSNFGSQPARSDLELYVDGHLADVRPLVVAARREQHLFWTDIPSGAQRLQVRLTVADNVALPLVLQKRGRAEIDARVAAVLAGVGLEEKARAYPAQLSGGQAQRVAIARAIVHQPAVLLADEPTGNLDSQTGATVLRLLRELADGGQAVLMATHSEDAAAICDRVVAMRDGRIV